jgi:hypothetical protein
MMTTRPLLAVLTAVAIPLASPAAAAQDAAVDPKCAAVRVAPPAGFAGWSVRTPVTAGAATRSAPVLVIGKAADLRLVAADRLAPAAPPGKDAAPGGTAGVALFQVARPGTYRVALGSGAWVDVVRGGRAIAAAAHGHGPQCSGIQKIVDFRLTPGRYVLQLTATQAPVVAVMIARAA